MKIVIVGDGKVGYTLAENLAKEDHDLTIVDKSAEALQRAQDQLDVLCVQGSGVSAKVLIEAGVGQADLLLAATSRDETNMVCALTGKKLGAKRTVARIRDPEYANEWSLLRNELDIDMVINPEQAAALEMVRLIQFPSAINIESFAKGRVQVVEIKMTGSEPIIGLPLKRLTSRVNASILIGAVARDGQVMIPDGQTQILTGDVLYIVGNAVNTYQFCRSMGKCTLKIRRVMIVGGGRVAYYLAQSILQMGIKVKIIELDHDRCQELVADLPEALIIHGDGSRMDLLESENLAEMDAFVAMTGRDEDNLIMSLMAKQAGVQKVITKSTRIQSEALFSALQLDSIVSPRLIATNHILQYVRGLQNAEAASIETLYQVVNGQAEILEFHIRQDRWYLNRKLKTLDRIPNTLIAAVVRHNEIIIPHGEDELRLFDRVILFAKATTLETLDTVFIATGSI